MNRPDADLATLRIEQLAREFHAIYQAEARRQGDVRHQEDYDSLPENIKEFDRVLARHVEAEIARLNEVVKQADDLLALYQDRDGDGEPGWVAEIARLRQDNDSLYMNEQATNHARVNDNAYLIERAEAAEREVARLQEGLRRTLFLAEHLFQMIDPQTWRDSGGDDGQGHYEGDYHAEKLREELEGFRALLADQERDTPGEDAPNRVLLDAEDQEGLRKMGAPVRCCGEWPECSHMLAWIETRDTPGKVLSQADYDSGLDTPSKDGAACEHKSSSFDRSVCACGSMHNYCDDCGRALDCPLDGAA